MASGTVQGAIRLEIVRFSTEVQNRMTTQIITDNRSEKLDIMWDFTRFALTRHDRLLGGSRVIILNPHEAEEVAKFINQFLPTKSVPSVTTGVKTRPIEGLILSDWSTY